MTLIANLAYSCDIPVGFRLFSNDSPLGLVSPMVFIWFSDGFAMVLLWLSRAFLIVFLWFSNGFPMLLLCFAYGGPMVFR